MIQVHVRFTGDESILRYDIEVIPCAELTDEDLPGHAENEEEFKRIIKSPDDNVTFGLRDKTRQPERGKRSCFGRSEQHTNNSIYKKMGGTYNEDHNL